MSTTDLYFRLQLDYYRRRITVGGELDIATALCLTTAVTALQHAGTGDITINLAEVTLIDDTGLDAVVAASATQVSVGRRLRVTHADASVSEAFVEADLDDLLRAHRAPVTRLSA
jgi:anti-anti-sigma factor